VADAEMRVDARGQKNIMRVGSRQEIAMTREEPEASSVPRDVIAYQARMLSGVSRTFALTIPSLPRALRVPVTNAYLLCRIADTIEDDAELPAERKRRLGRRFVEVLAGRADADAFARDAAPLLSPATPSDERELLSRSTDVVRVTRSLPGTQRRALVRCVSLMSDGMHRFQRGAGLQGLACQREMDEYCYFVAGVVGEMLTELFCAHSEAIGKRRERLLTLAPSFGQGLQMTNILKDVWEDHARGICWLPRSAFGVDAADAGDLLRDVRPAGLERGIERLVVVAHGHLRNALAYTLLIPRRHLAIRRFCLWALGMAVPTLANIHARPGFRAGTEVKITRAQVRAIVRRYGLCAPSNALLRQLFARASKALPASDPARTSQLQDISRRAGSDPAHDPPGEPVGRSLGVH
jgi:farnesyl-diphosphate farnesyltransferase